MVFTLDPNKFAEKKQGRLHIGDQQSFRLYVSLHNRLHHHKLLYDPTALSFYPPDTKAFLYYSMSPEKPRIAGELRLRVASSDDITSFESGSDLLLPKGQTWSRPLYALSKHYGFLYKMLREDRLVPDDLDTILSSFPTKNMKYTRGRLLYTLNDTFIVDFSSQFSCAVITEQGMEILHFYKPFFGGRGMNFCRPYTGAYTSHFLSILLY